METLSGNMTEKELERAIEILVDSVSLEELESNTYDSTVICKMVDFIHSTIKYKQGKMQVAY